MLVDEILVALRCPRGDEGDGQLLGQALLPAPEAREDFAAGTAVRGGEHEQNRLPAVEKARERPPLAGIDAREREVGRLRADRETWWDECELPARDSEVGGRL